MKNIRLKTLLAVILTAGLVAGCGDRRKEIELGEQATTDYLNKKETCRKSGMASFWAEKKKIFLDIHKCEDGSIYIFNIE